MFAPGGASVEFSNGLVLSMINNKLSSVRIGTTIGRENDYRSKIVEVAIFKNGEFMTSKVLRYTHFFERISGETILCNPNDVVSIMNIVSSWYGSTSEV